MLALFQCCAKPFFAASQESTGLRGGPGFRQPHPIILCVRCPHCSQRAEALLAPPCVLAHNSPTIQAGIRLLREPHGALLSPIHLSSGRRIQVPIEGDSPLTRAWDLVIALSAAANASSAPRRDELSLEATSAILIGLNPELRSQVGSATAHCEQANAPKVAPTCNWEQVRLSWKRSPETLEQQ